MQLGAVNSINFGLNRPAIIDMPQSSYREVGADKSFVDKEGDFFDKVEAFENAAEKINSNVHPMTIAATVLTALVAAKGASRVIPYVRKSAVKAGEAISKTAVKGFGTVANKVKQGSVDTQKVLSSITQKADKLRLDNRAMAKAGRLDEVTNHKVLAKVQKHIGDIIGEDSAQTFVDALKKNKIVNGVGLFDALAAGAIAVSGVDHSSDKIEGMLDSRDLRDAFCELIAE